MSKIRIEVFSTSRCGPCRSYANHLTNFKHSNTDPDVNVIKHLDDMSLMQKNQVTAVPTTFFFVDGIAKGRVVGPIVESDLKKIVEELKGAE